MSNLKQTLSGMTFREKVDHIWTYYKIHILGTLLLSAILISWGVSAYNNSKEVLLQGELVNVTITDAGYSYLAQDSFAALGGTNNRQTVNIISSFTGDPNTNPSAYMQQLKILAQIEGQNLDFLILDETLFRQYAYSEFYMDLREFFTETELVQYANSIAYADPVEAGDPYPAGIMLDGTHFATECLPDDSSCYLVLIANTQRLPACRAFWEHILSYNT